jgi:hypothetical protein
MNRKKQDELTLDAWIISHSKPQLVANFLALGNHIFIIICTIAYPLYYCLNLDESSPLYFHFNMNLLKPSILSTYQQV